MSGDMDGNQYWNGWWRQRLSRRRLMAGGAGLAGLALIGCGQEEATTPAGTATPAGTGTAAATGTAVTTTTPPPALTATATIAVSGSPVPGGTLPIAGWSGGYISWDPRYGDDWDPSAFYSFTHDRMIVYRYGPKYGATDFTPTPSLGESWEQVDATTLNVKVRSGVKWRNVDPVNGRGLNAEDIKYSYEQQKAPESTHAESLKPIVSITMPDAATLVFKTDAPFAPLLSNLAAPHYPVFAKEVIQKFGKLSAPAHLIGTGPWYIDDSYTEGVKATFVRNQDYWRGPNGVTGEQLPYLEKIEMSLDAEWQTTVAQFRSGELAAPGNWMAFWGLEGQDIKDIEDLRAAIPGMQEELHARPYMDRIIWMRTDKPPFNDVRIRQAMSMATDRDAWMKNVYQGRASRGREFAQSNPWFLPNAELGDAAKFQTYDLAEATALLSAAGFADGLKSVIHTTTASGPVLQTEAEYFVEEMRQIGVELEFVVYSDSTAWSAGPFAGKFDDGLAYGYGESFYDPDPFFDIFRPDNPRNRSHISGDTVLDGLIEKQRGEVDLASREAVIDDIQRQTATQLYYIVTVDPPQASAWQPWLKNWIMFEGADYGTSFVESWVER